MEKNSRTQKLDELRDLLDWYRFDAADSDFVLYQDFFKVCEKLFVSSFSYLFMSNFVSFVWPGDDIFCSKSDLIDNLFGFISFLEDFTDV